MKTNSLSQDFLKLAINKSILKEYQTSKSNRTVYLKNGTEFQLQLFNPLTFTICADIYINDEKIPNSLVIKPGQRVWLERYLDRAKKFLYETYEVENGNAAVEAAIKNNGLIQVKCYKEDINKNTYKSPLSGTISTSSNIDTFRWSDFNDCQVYDNVYNSSITDAKLNDSFTTYTSNATARSFSQPTVSTVLYSSLDMITEPLLSATCDCSVQNTVATTVNYDVRDTKKTGRIQEGSKSNQLLHDCDMEFSNWSFKTEIIQILPESEKPYTVSDLQKQYCTECGRKLNPKHKFCPYCGTKQ
jgi:rRNA maturation endonuclease Nob1